MAHLERVRTHQRFQFTHPGRGATSDPFVAVVDPAFQFTHPGRGATSIRRCGRASSSSFNSRTPGGVRPTLQGVADTLDSVSIHAPREGCDAADLWALTPEDVSIHAPREGCDARLMHFARQITGFNSRTPGGVRQCGAKLRIIGRINKRNLREGEGEGRAGARLLLWFWLCG